MLLVVQRFSFLVFVPDIIIKYQYLSLLFPSSSDATQVQGDDELLISKDTDRIWLKMMQKELDLFTQIRNTRLVLHPLILSCL